MISWKAVTAVLAFAVVVFPGCDRVPHQHDPFLGADVHAPAGSIAPISAGQPVHTTAAKPPAGVDEAWLNEQDDDE